MTHGFDKGYWEDHWREGRRGEPGSMAENPPHPHLARETADLVPGTARLDGAGWKVITAEERHRTLPGPGGREVPLHDVVVRATRRS